MLKIGITGGIGSGKSLVSKVFTTLGVPVFDADATAKKIMEEDANLVKKIIEYFGQNTYINGKLNRAVLAEIVFNNPEKLQLLNSITHPATIAAAAKWTAAQTAPYCLKEAALLFEAGTAKGLDFIIGVSAPNALRIQRVMQRDNTTRENVLARMDKQLNESLKMKLCNYIIINDNTKLVLPQVVKLHKELLNII